MGSSIKEAATSSDNEKALSVDETHTPVAASDQELDSAYLYMKQNENEVDGSAEIDLAALRRKIDWRIVPIMFAAYTMQFIDKVCLNYANVMGLSKDLNLQGNDFSNAASAFFIAYLIAEVPNGYFLQKVPVAKWLGANIILWGIATACCAASFNYESLLAARIFLGIFEAAIAPCLMLISSQWYTKSEQAPRFSFWYCGLGAGQIIGGLVSFGFQHVTEGSLKGWQIMFIVLGILTAVVGVGALWILPDTPMQAKFLTETEKSALLKHVSVNQTGIENHKFKWSHFKELMLDIQIWLMLLVTILISISSGVITSYSATLIAGFGYTRPQSALLNTPSGLVSIFFTLAVGFGVRHTSHRWAWLAACCVPGMLGGGLMSFSKSKAAKLAGIYMVNAIVATLAIIYQWTVANCAGASKRVIASALIAGSFSIGNIIGPQTFQKKDAPDYIPAKITVMATQAAGAVFTVVLFGYYVFMNKRKDARQANEQSDSEQSEANNWVNKTDKENKDFRYVY